MAKFDLHLHSSNSDGSFSVKELVKKVLDEDIEIFALTDHDTVNGIFELENQGLTDSSYLKFIRGIELTCKIDNIKCHILGYNINPKNDALTQLIEQGKKLRRQKLDTRIAYLKEVWNIVLTKNELDWLYSRKSVVKTHIGNILVERGLAGNNVDAMKKYLDSCKTGNTRFNGEDAIKTIIEAGGVPVWAHPLGGEGEKHISKEDFIPQLKTMIEAGIQGLECYYSRYNMEEIEFLKACAKEYNLLISGGSDWHGTNKTVPIGRLNQEGMYIDSAEATIVNLL